MQHTKDLLNEEHSKQRNPDFLVQRFFRTFSEALTAGDIEAIKKCWALPSYVVGNAIQMVVKSGEEIERFFASTKWSYLI